MTDTKRTTEQYKFGFFRYLSERVFWPKSFLHWCDENEESLQRLAHERPARRPLPPGVWRDTKRRERRTVYA